MSWTVYAPLSVAELRARIEERWEDSEDMLAAITYETGNGWAAAIGTLDEGFDLADELDGYYASEEGLMKFAGGRATDPEVSHATLRGRLGFATTPVRGTATTMAVVLDRPAREVTAALCAAKGWKQLPDGVTVEEGPHGAVITSREWGGLGIDISEHWSEAVVFSALRAGDGFLEVMELHAGEGVATWAEPGTPVRGFGGPRVDELRGARTAAEIIANLGLPLHVL
ncbi:MAG: hypothetical protein ABI678_19330 [Kofleriaceae bacterium]